jgi:hypothetical protein
LTDTMSSISEITRVGGWALRGLGYPLGVAERATRLLAWTQAVDGTALKSIKELETVIEASLQADPVVIRKATLDDEINGSAKHLLEIGPPVLDLATSNARLNGIGHADLSNVYGLNFVPALGRLLELRKLDAMIVYRAQSRDVLPKTTPASGWLLVSASHGRHAFRVGDMNDHPEKLVQEMFEIAGRGQGLDIATRIASRVNGFQAEGTGGYMSVTAIQSTSAQHLRVGSFLNSVGKPHDFRQRLEDAFYEGFSVDKQDLQYLYQLEMRTWAPTSERSRSQAGYGIY